MSEVEIPEFPKKDIRISSIEVRHGGMLTLHLGFNHRKDCLKANEFLSRILSEMISDEDL